MANVVPSGPQWAQDLSEELKFNKGLRDFHGPIPAAKGIFEHRLDAHPPRRQRAEIPCSAVWKHPSHTEAQVLGIANPDAGCPVAKLKSHLRLAHTVGAVDPDEHRPMVCRTEPGERQNRRDTRGRQSDSLIVQVADRPAMPA